MSRASSIVKKFNRATAKNGPMARLAYKRVITSTGGSTLLGRGVTTTPVDALCDPQPMYERITERIVLTTSAAAEAGDYKFGFSLDALSIAELQSKSFMLVLKNAAGVEEALDIFHYADPSIQGEYFIFTVYARSKF
jgi:hypothetical protein